MSIGRVGHTATRLLDGRVLVTGGRDFRDPTYSRAITYSSAEIFDPASGAWHLAAPMHHERSDHVALRLSDGRIFVVGGHDPATRPLTEIYDPARDVWTETAAVPGASLSSVTALDDGTLLALGGLPSAGAAPSDQRYDPATNTWSPAARCPHPSVGHAAVKLPSGRVMVVAGDTGLGDRFLSSSDVYDPKSDTWTSGPPVPGIAGSVTVATLADGSFVVSGESNPHVSGPPWGVARFDERTFAWTTLPAFPPGFPRFFALPDGRLLSTSGLPDASASREIDALSADASAWRPIGVRPARSAAATIALLDGRLLFIGGYPMGSNEAVSVVDAFTPEKP